MCAGRRTRLMSDCDRMLGSKYTLVRRDQCRSRFESVRACVYACESNGTSYTRGSTHDSEA
jgi:hypothetical protein